MSFMAAQQSLSNVFESIRFSNPGLANQMQSDFVAVAIHATASDKSLGQGSAVRLRMFSSDLPEIQKRVLNNTLDDLGYE